MTPKQILQCNKLIGEFMGGSFEKKFRVAPIGIPVFALDANEVEKLKYDRSWDWLMPVWFKFRDTRITSILKRHIHQNICDVIRKSLYGYGHEEVYNDIIMAIKWYNEQIKQS